MGALVLLVIAGAIGALIYVPKWQVPVCPPDQQGLPSKICFDIENEARRTLAYILGGLLAIIGIYMAHRRIRALENQVLAGQEQLKVAQNQLQVAQEGQITERFTRSIEQLGSDKVEVRLGGIYALERIANDSDKDYWPIMETLTAYVRERAPWREQSLDANKEKSGEDQATAEGPLSPWLEPKIKPPTDIQAILTVLRRRKYRYGQGETENLDLGSTDLRGAVLSKAHLEGALLSKAHLEGAKLLEAHLERADLGGTHLEGGNLYEAHLEEAFLRGAYLERAQLWKAHLERATICEAHLEGAVFQAAHLEEAKLWEAYLEGANLWVAHLEGAELFEAHLERANLKGANLERAKGLTREQLAEAIMDDKTILPDYLQDQPQEASEPGGADASGSRR